MADNGSAILMADYLVTSTELKSVADAIRAKGGTTEQLTFPEGFISAVESIPSGGELPELTKPAAVSDVLEGKEYIGAAGEKRTGTLVVCDTVEDVKHFGTDGIGVQIELESSADGSSKTITLPETNLLPENIKSGVSVFGVLGTLSLSLFDNENDCEIGTFELAEDKKDGYVVSLKRTDVEPYMIAFWMDDPKFTDDSGNPITYKIGGLFIKSSLYNSYSCVGIISVNSSLGIGGGASGFAYRVYPESGGIYIGSSSTYPLKAGIRYKWIARWLN